MKLRRTLTFTLASTALAPLAAADGKPVFLAAPGGGGDVLVFDASGGAPPTTPPALQGITLLPIDFPGRTELDRFASDRPRLEEDVPGAGRLVLPGAHGSLYRYRRPAGGAGAWYGLFLVETDGDVVPLWEAPGTGPTGDVDPFATRVASTADGGTLLFGTTAAAAGDVLELTLADGTVLNRTSDTPPLQLTEEGLGVGEQWGWFSTTAGAWRFDRVVGETAQPVPLVGAPTQLLGGFAVSGDGARVALVAGSGPNDLYVHSFGSSGAATRASAIGGALSGIGSLPAHADGPFLSLSADGSLCCWRATVGATRECFLARTAPLDGDTPFHLTADNLFLDTLDEPGLIGPLFSVGADAMTIAVGERADPVLGGIESADFYRVELAPGGGATFTNLSQSSGDPQAPFLESKSTIDPEDGVFRVPGQSAVVFVDTSTDQLSIVRLDTGGMLPILANVKELNAITALESGALVLEVRRSNGEKNIELVRVDPSTGATVLASLPSDHAVGESSFTALTAGPGDAFASILAVGSFEFLLTMDASTGAAQVLSYAPLAYGPTLDYEANGSLAFSVAAGAGQVFASWGFPFSILPLPPTPGFVLPG